MTHPSRQNGHVSEMTLQLLHDHVSAYFKHNFHFFVCNISKVVNALNKKKSNIFEKIHTHFAVKKTLPCEKKFEI